MKTPLFVMLALFVPAIAYADDCTPLVEKAESADGQEAVASAKQAVAACKRAHVKTARPYMVLAVQANKAGKLNEVITWSRQGLEQEPGLPLAYMNICAAQMQMKKYDDAVQSCTDGLKEKSEWSAKLNFNLGLALFKKAVDAKKFNEAIKAEPYFIESKKIDQSIAQNDYYLGVLEESVKGNPQAALSHYQPACTAGDKPSCEGLARVRSAAAPQQAQTAVASADEEKLWTALEAAYKKKGVDEASAKQTVANIRNGMSGVPSAQRVQSLNAMLDALK